jgi:apolipoprotein N-acyltransferase
VETGRTVLVAATTGISAIIDPSGRIIEELGEGQAGWMVSEVPLRDSWTVAVRVGEFPEMLLAFSALVGLVWSVTRHRRASRRPGERSTLTPDVGSRP